MPGCEFLKEMPSHRECNLDPYFKNKDFSGYDGPCCDISTLLWVNVFRFQYTLR